MKYLSFPVKLIPVVLIGAVAVLIGVRWEDIREQATYFLF